VTRRHLAFVILAAWVGALSWLAAREFGRRGIGVAAGQQVVSPGAAYYRVMLDTAQVGYALLQVDTLAPTDSSPALVTLQSRLLLSTGSAPKIERYELVTTTLLTTDLRLWRSESQRGDPDGVTRWRVVVRGDSLVTTFFHDDEEWTTTTLVDSVPVPVEAVPLWFATFVRPRPGNSSEIGTLDLATLERRRETWVTTSDSTFLIPDSVVGDGAGSYRVASYDTVLAWRLSGTDRSVQVHRWIDENGFPITWSTGGGLRFERDAFEIALGGFRRISDSVTGRSALRPFPVADASSLLGQPRREWTLLLAGAEYPPLDGAGPMQRITGDTVELFPPNNWRSQQSLRPLEPLPMRNPRFAIDLLPGPRSSPEDTAVTARARSLAGNTQNAREAALTLTAWVHRNIATVAGEPGVRPAGAVLAAKRGTPEEQAVLLVAMARRVGLPARLVGGIVLTKGGARTHTWAELFIGDWVPVDPSEGTGLASPAHLRLVAGGTGRWTDLLPLAGRTVATGREPHELP
jgi:hypothetical protein